METINNLGLKDENIYPDETILKSVLGNSYKFYNELFKERFKQLRMQENLSHVFLKSKIKVKF